jgi:hypothetical protein
MTITPAQLEQIRIQATAEKVRRQREGAWSAGVQAHTDYQTRPEDWIVEFLGVPRETIRWSMLPEYADHQWDGTVDPLVAILEAIAENRDCGVESGTGTGKTYLLACVILWALATHENALVVTAAPKEDQLLKNVWKEVGKLWPRFERHFPQAQLQSGRILMRPDASERDAWTAFAFVAGVGADEEAAQKAAGFHSAYMFWITEETPGMHQAIMNTIQNTRTGSRNPQLAVGNPDHRNDPLHRFCTKPWVEHVRISAYDHPNIVCGREVIPGAVSRQSIERRADEYGRGSRLYESRVRGISPAEAEDSLIKWEWCVAAAERYNDPSFREGPPALGVDVANSESGDRGAKARWQGACLTEVPDFPCPDANVLGAEVVAEARAAGIDPRHVGVDSVGVGAGTVNEAKRLGFKVRDLSGARKAVPGFVPEVSGEHDEDELAEVPRDPSAPRPRVIEAERYANLRSQVWYRMREDLRLGLIALPYDESLFQDLTTPTYTTQNGKIVVESKESMVKRLKRSPNKGDAACYGNFVRPRPVRPKPKEQEVPDSTPNRDRGLEMLVARLQKQQAAEAKRFERMLNRPTRSRL